MTSDTANPGRLGRRVLTKRATIQVEPASPPVDAPVGQEEAVPSVRIIQGDCLAELPKLGEEGFRAHACVCDPPYHLTSTTERFGADDAAPAQYGTDGAFSRLSRGFMGQRWDGGDVAFRVETWKAVYDRLLPGAHLLAFGGTRRWHRLACAIEDAGFEIRDTICWLYGSGFPKGRDISKSIDKEAGAEREVIGGRLYQQRGVAHGGGKTLGGGMVDITAPATAEAAQFEGWKTGLRPAFEPVIVARKPVEGTIASNVVRYGCGALNIDASRISPGELVPGGGGYRGGATSRHEGWQRPSHQSAEAIDSHVLGRWPTNVILSYPEDAYVLSPSATQEQRAELFKWLSENVA